MNKILLAIDGRTLDMNSLNFACYLAMLSGAKITGIFLGDIEREDNIRKFTNVCLEQGVDCLVHRDMGVPLDELIIESRYADLVILDADITFSKNREEVPTKLAKDILLHVECPVIIAPETFEQIDEIVFAYNGSHEAMSAIKQFTYLFPLFNGTKLSLVAVGDSMFKEQHKVVEWLNLHYRNVSFHSLPGDDAGHILMEYMLTTGKAILIIGAYGRSLMSNYLRASTVNKTLKFTTKPVFITHQ